MKNSLLIVLMSIMTFSCTTYETTVSGVSNSSSIKVVKANKTVNNYDKGLTLVIDNKEFVIGKIFTDKNNIKAATYPILSGKNKVIIKRNNDIIYEKTLFISNRETRKIILE